MHIRERLKYLTNFHSRRFILMWNFLKAKTHRGCAVNCDCECVHVLICVRASVLLVAMAVVSFFLLH